MASGRFIVLISCHWNGKHYYNDMDNDGKDSGSSKRIFQVSIHKVRQILLDSQTTWPRIAYCQGMITFALSYPLPFYIKLK